MFCAPEMAEGVGQRLTPDEQNFLLHDFVQWPWTAFHADLEVRGMNGPDPSARLGQGVGQVGAVGSPAAQIQYSFAPLFASPGRIASTPDPKPRAQDHQQAAGRQLGAKAKREPEETLQEGVVQLPGDALPLRHSFGQPAPATHGLCRECGAALLTTTARRPAKMTSAVNHQVRRKPV